MTLLTLGLSAGLRAAATVDANVTNQFIRGFGAASAWNGQATLAPAAAALWANDNLDGHAGLSILRTRIDPTGAFANEAGPMTLAKGQNPNILIWSTEWTPPAAYKNNNSVNGPGANNTFNNTAANSTAYANYLVNYIKTIKSTYGVDLYAISPQNEPDWNTSYESCLWTAAQFHDFVKNYLNPALVSNSLSTKIMIPESFSDNLAMAADTMNDAVSAPMVSIIGNHIYGGGPRPLSAGGWSYLSTQESWQTEMSDVSGATHDPGMPAALQIMGWVYSCMVTASMNAYLHWWIYSYTGDNSGLFGADTTTPTKKLYALGNFSKFVRPGWYRMGGTLASGNSGVNLVAFKDAAGTPAHWAIVAINTNTSPVTQSFNLSNFNATSCTPWVTDASNNLVHQASVAISGNSFSYTLPAQSVVSFVGSGGGIGTPTRTPTYAGTPTSTPTASPTPVTQLFDDFEDVNTADNWGGSWATYAGSASSLTLTVAAGGAPGSTLGSASVVGTIADYGGLTGTFSGSPRDLSAYVGIQFMVKGSGTYWWQVATAAVTDGDHYGASFTASGTWTLVTIYFANLTQRGFGAAVPKDLTGSQYFQWASSANGAFNLQIDDVKLLTYSLPTATPSPTVTRTASPSASPTVTRSVTGSPTISNSPSATPTRSATASASPTRSATPSATASPTPSATVSASPTASPTGTRSVTGSPTLSNSPSATQTRSSTPSPTVTVTFLDSYTISPTRSPSSSPSPSVSATPQLPSATPTPQLPSATPTPQLPSATPTPLLPSATPTPLLPSATPTPQLPSATASPSATAVLSSPTATLTDSPTSSASPSASPTASPSRTTTPSVTPSQTLALPPPPSVTRSLTPSPSATATASPTPPNPVTSTPEPSAVSTASATASPSAVVAGDGPLVIEAARAWPNPNPRSIAVLLQGPAEKVLLKVYTPAWILVGRSELAPLAKGWSRLPLPDALAQAPKGLYYFTVQAFDGGRQSQAKTGRLLLLPQ